MRVFMNKNCLSLLAGCAIFLCADACGRKACAIDYPNVATLEKHWEKGVKTEMFKELYREPPPLLSENFPGNGAQASPFKMYFNGKENPFGTAADLNQLPCDACLKKICNVLCSSKFLAIVLLQNTVDVLREGNKVTTIKIETLNPKSFFDKYKRLKLKMTIERDTPYPNTRFLALFVFVFKKVVYKEAECVSIQASRFECTLPSGKTEEYCSYALRLLSDSPCGVLLQVPKKVADVWSGLEIPFMVELSPFDVSIEWEKSPYYFYDGETREKLLSCGLKLKSKAFLEGIFTKNVLDFFKCECSTGLYTPGLWMGYIVVPLYKGQPARFDVDELDIRLYITNAYEDLDSDEIPEGKQVRLRDRCLNTISDLHFTLDIRKNKIYNAKFLGDLKLNGCVLMENGRRNPRFVKGKGTRAGK